MDKSYKDWPKISESTQLATFGAGCYWGTEKFYAKDYEKLFPGSILATKVGFMSVKEEKPEVVPTYREVCTGTSPYVEVCQLLYDSKLTSFENICRFFFTFHDPTTHNYQGNDRGPQYASVIFYHN